MKIFFGFFLALIYAIIVQGYDFNYDVGASLHDKIIHIESLRYRGHWLKSSYHNAGKWIAVYALAERDTYYTQWSQFKVKHIGGGKVLFESLTYPHHYFDAHHTGWVGMTYSTYPDNQRWAQWKIYCTSTKMNNCRIESMRYRGEYFDSSHTGGLGVSGYGDWYSRFRILAPKPSDYYSTVWSTENKSGVEQKKTLTMEEGTIDTQTTENTITTSVSVEVSKAFLTASASVSHEWKQTNSKTFERRTSFAYEVRLPPHSKIEIKQLTGNYGPFEIAASNFIIQETNLKTGKGRTITA